MGKVDGARQTPGKTSLTLTLDLTSTHSLVGFSGFEIGKRAERDACKPSLGKPRH